nr:DUF488 family protein [uncultured Halomonas sp.]
MSQGDIRLRRAYDAPANNDGKRILVDGMWPRGIKKEEADIDEWLKELAPSKGLRQWFGHDPDKWEEFQKRYREELKNCPDAMKKLRKYHQDGRITLVFAAKDEEHNNAVVLKHVLQKED